MSWNLKDQTRDRTERLRGWIVYLLYKARPQPLEMVTLIRLLDKFNQPVSRRRLAEEIDFLRGSGLVRVFPGGSDQWLDEVIQVKLIQRFAATATDDEMGATLCARLSSVEGINFQEGVTDAPGVQRVE